MTKDTAKNDFYITFNLVDSTATNYLSFVPTGMYFRNEYDNNDSYDHNRTTDLNATLIPGYTYEFSDTDQFDSNSYYYYTEKKSYKI